MSIEIRFRSPFDADVGFAAIAHSPARGSYLLPAEEAIAPRGRSLRRRLAFDLGRGAAHAALESVGRPVEPVLRGARGAPLWSTGCVGSISHTVVDGTVCAVAAVADAGRYGGVGLDLERVRPVSCGVLQRIASPAEVAWAHTTTGLYPLRAIAVFAAREALFKAVSPGYSGRMRYHETELRWDGGRRGFLGVTLLPAEPARGRLESFISIDVRGGCVLAAVVIPPRPR